jgi:hypothetical protein
LIKNCGYKEATTEQLVGEMHIEANYEPKKAEKKARNA